MERCHRAGVAAFGWDAQDRAAMDRLLALGVDGIYSDFPDRLVAAIAEHAGGLTPAGQREARVDDPGLPERRR